MSNALPDLSTCDDTDDNYSGNPPTRTLIGGVVFKHRQEHTQDITTILQSVRQLTFLPHSDGLCSDVYKVKLTPKASLTDPSLAKIDKDEPVLLKSLSVLANQQSGSSGWLCVKRVTVEDQCRPHSVELELALLDRLSHRNIVQLLVACQDTSDPFGTVIDLYMPFYPVSLAQVLDEPSLVPNPQTTCNNDLPYDRPSLSLQPLWSQPDSCFLTFFFSVARQLCSALSYLHSEKNIAHRDVKPANILIAQDGTLKLVDFGTALDLSGLESMADAHHRKEPSERRDSANGMVFQVGTGIFRAPELLFAPTNGYDACKVDVWAAAVTLSHFFTQLGKADSPPRAKHVAVPPNVDPEQQQDNRPSWQRSFWDDDNNQPIQSQSSSIHGWHDDDDDDSTSNHGFWLDQPEVEKLPVSPTGYIRQPLFEGNTGDIALASSIFDLLGLPTTEKEWPEAMHFQPPLNRLPFSARTGKGLRPKLVYLQPSQQGSIEVAGLSTDQRNQIDQFLTHGLYKMLSLSATKRPSFSQILQILDHLESIHTDE